MRSVVAVANGFMLTTSYSNICDRATAAMTWAIFAINLMALAEQTSNRSHFLHGEEEFKKSYQYLGGISGGSWHEGSCSQVPGAPCGSGTGNFITGSGVRSAAAAALVLLFCCDVGLVLTTMYIPAMWSFYRDSCSL